MQPVPQVGCGTWLWNTICCCCPIDDTTVTNPPEPAQTSTQRWVHRHQESMDSRIGRSAEAAKVVARGINTTNGVHQ